MGKTRKIGNGLEICEMFLLCQCTVCAAMLPATEPHKDVKRKAIVLQCQDSCVSKNPKHQITYTSLFTVYIYN